MKFNKIYLEDFKFEIEKDDYKTIYNNIFRYTAKLAKELAKLKSIKLDGKKDKYLLYRIEDVFKEEFAVFRDMKYIAKELLEWDCPDEYFLTEPKMQVEYCISLYNSIINEFDTYIKTEEDIKKNGYKILLETKKNRLIELFKKMLEFKDKKYDENWTFEQFVYKIYVYYNIYSLDLDNAESAINYGTVRFDVEDEPILTNDVENIMILDDLYNYLSFKDNYKNDAYFYRDFELEEGQTYKDLYNLEKEKFVKLFKEMLDFLNEPYDKNDNDLDRLSIKVEECYPYYSEILRFLIPSDLNATYIEILDSMESKYECIVENYKNHEENMKKYEERMKHLEDDIEDYFLDEE